MKKKLPIGIQDFQELISGGYYYIDKTESIYNILESNKYYFLSRPRRFGKSLTLSVMKNLYLGKKELFKNTWVYDKWDFEQTNPVIYMSFAGYTYDQDIKEYIRDRLKVHIDNEEYLLSDFTDRLNIVSLLEGIYKKTSKQIAIIIDEYDKTVLQHLTNVEKAEEMRDFFMSFYSGIKDSDNMVKVFMLTGLTKVLKMSVFSVLNNLKDISYSPLSYKIMGYTEEELESNFEQEIREMAKDREKTYEEMIEVLKQNYNGYNFGDGEDTIYNPWNVNNFITDRRLSFYWADTGIPSAILNYIDKNQIKVNEFITELNEGYLKVEESDFKLEDLNNINVPVLFTNAGYLTIKKYKEFGGYILGYPNAETEKVMNSFFLKLCKPNYNFSLMEEIANGIYEGITNKDEELLKESLRRMIYEFMEDTAYEWINKNPEGWLKTFIGLFLRMNTVYYYPEVQNLKGRKDFVIPLDDKYYVLEAKVDKDVSEAIEQINKKYLPQLTDREVVKVGVSWIREKEDFEVKVA